MEQNLSQLIQQGIKYYHAGQLTNAANCYQEVLQQSPDQPDALHLLGLVERDHKQFNRAVQLMEHAIQLAPSNANYYNSLANVYQDMGDLQQALACYQTAITLESRDPQLHNNIGTLYKNLRQGAKAIEHFNQALQLDSGYAMPLYNLGNMAMEAGDQASAIDCYHRALKLQPSLLDAWINVGISLHALGKYDAALDAYRCALDLHPESVTGLCNMGTTLAVLDKESDSVACYLRAYELEPASLEVASNLLKYTSQYLLWDQTELLKQTCIEQIPQHVQKANSLPLDLFATLSLSFPIELHVMAAKHKAQHYENLAHRLGKFSHSRGEKREKLRIGYVSNDFRVHAVGIMVYQLFQAHNAEKVEVVLFNLNHINDSLTDLMFKTCVTMINLHGIADKDAAHKIYQHKIDVLIDMSGFTFGSRPLIFALRPAPIQVSYIGFLGTCAAPFHDYIIADKTMYGAEEKKYFTETPVLMPHSFTAISQCPFADRVIKRGQYDIPEDAFVFCTFNTLYKVDRQSLELWFTILKNAPEKSVFWFYDSGSQSARQAVLTCAKQHGVAENRLYFANKVSIGEAVARMRCADLFLDSLSYSAGATAAMAYWAHLPVLSYAGSRFVSRMGASFAQSLGCPEMITQTTDDYFEQALRLSRDPQAYRNVKQKVMDGVKHSPLFDISGFAADLEKVYAVMWEQYSLDCKMPIVIA